MSTWSIDKNRLLSELPHLSDEELPWQLQEFSSLDFTLTNSEQGIAFYQIAKTTDLDPVIFWLKTRQYQQFPPYLQADIERATPHQISAEECHKKIAWCTTWFKYPQRIHLEGKILKAYSMIAVWNEESLLIETENKYFVFCWGTAA